MSNDKDFNPDDTHFSDEELEAALAGFEKEFENDTDTGDDDQADSAADAKSIDNGADTQAADDISSSVADAVHDAMADVVLVDGARGQNVTISTVGGHAVKNTDTTCTVASSSVSDYYMVNADYYNHIFTYSVNADGSYDLVKYCDATNVNRPQHWRSYHYQGQDRYHCWLHQHGCCQH